LANGAGASLEQLYRSAYLIEAIFGNKSQQRTNPHQLVLNHKGGVETYVGMSMAPSLWLTNFALLYTLKPAIAAQMPAYWTPIPEPVAGALIAAIEGDRRTGFVRYADYMSYLPPVG